MMLLYSFPFRCNDLRNFTRWDNNVVKEESDILPYNVASIWLCCALCVLVCCRQLCAFFMFSLFLWLRLDALNICNNIFSNLNILSAIFAAKITILGSEPDEKSAVSSFSCQKRNERNFTSNKNVISRFLIVLVWFKDFTILFLPRLAVTIANKELGP